MLSGQCRSVAVTYCALLSPGRYVDSIICPNTERSWRDNVLVAPHTSAGRRLSPSSGFQSVFGSMRPTCRLHRDRDWDGTLERIHHALYVETREREGREASPTAAIIDSQSARAAQKGAPRSTRRATMRARRSLDASVPSSSIRLVFC